MKKLALAMSAVAAFTGQALAADMPMKAVRAAPVVVATSWTGCYVGGGGGYGMYYQENTGYVDGPPRVQVTDTFTNSGKGWFGTVQAGCDYQFNTGPWAIVVGAFGDYDFSDIHGRRTDVLTPGVGNETLTDSWAVGGRIGALVTPQLLAYFSGGYSEASFSGSTYTNLLGPPFGVLTGFNTHGSTFKGWFVGAGDEYALSFLPGLFWKTEARAYHYDRQTQLNFTNAGVRTNDSYDAEKWVYSVRSELVYRFNFGGPAVVAKY